MFHLRLGLGFRHLPPALVSANPKVDEQLMGQANGDWAQWYIAFAESPLVIGYSPSSRFVNDLRNKSWYEVLAEPGLKLGRTDPNLDPKGVLTIELLNRAEAFYSKPGLSQQIIGAPLSSPQFSKWGLQIGGQ